MADVTVERTTTTTHPTHAGAGYNPQYQQYPYQRGQLGQQQHPITDSIKGMLPDRGPSASQVAAVATLVPVGGILLAISGVTLTGTVIGLAVATPLFVIFSPILVPAALAVALGVTGFLASGALGLTGLSSLSWILSHIRGVKGTVYEQMDYAKRRAQETAGQVGHQIGQRTKDVGQGIQNRSHEIGRTEGGRTEGERRTTTHEGGRTTTTTT